MRGMRTVLVPGLALMCLAANSPAADKAPCASKPFSLTKSAPAPAKPVAQRVKKAAPTKVAAKPLADCKKKAS
jgi:hypothetical protein